MPCRGIPSILSFRAFIELSLTFRFLNHLKLIFVYNASYGYNFIFPHTDNQLSQTCLLTNLSFSTNPLCQLYYIQSFSICVSLVLGFHFIQLDSLHLHQCHNILNYWRYIKPLHILYVCLLIKFFYKNVLAILGLPINSLFYFILFLKTFGRNLLYLQAKLVAYVFFVLKQKYSKFSNSI